MRMSLQAQFDRSGLEAPPVRIGMVGTGFVAKGVYKLLESQGDLVVSKVLTRRPFTSCPNWLPESLITHSATEMIEMADIVLECSGDTLHACDTLLQAGKAGRKLVTMNSEVQVTIGTALLRRGYYLTEALGDQPGCLAELRDEAVELGFKPLAFLNLKGFLNLNPDVTEMQHWADKQGLSLRSVTSFTDGSKLQIEQVLVANGLGAQIAQRGMIGGTTDDLSDLDHFVEASVELGAPISDYVLNPGGPPGVLILAQNPAADIAGDYLPFTRLKTKGGLAYRLLRPHHLVYLEIPRTLRRVAGGAMPLLNNSTQPVATVATVAKRKMKAGHIISEALGGFDVRAEAIKLEAKSEVVPITLMDRAKLRRDVQAGGVITWDDVELEPSTALDMYYETHSEQGAVTSGGQLGSVSSRKELKSARKLAVGRA